jgi:hypothetical protein
VRAESRVNQWISVGANVAVLLGLIFVGLEVRNSRAAAEAQAADGIADGFLQLNLLYITDSTVAKVWQRGSLEPNSLSDMEALQFSMHMRALFNQYTRVHRLYRAGLIREEDWELYGREAATLMATPGGLVYFAGNDLPADFERDVLKYEGMAPVVDLRLGR